MTGARGGPEPPAASTVVADRAAWAGTDAGRVHVGPRLARSAGRRLTLAGGEHLVAAAVVGDDLHVVRSSADGLVGAMHVVPGARGPALAFDGDTLVLT